MIKYFINFVIKFFNLRRYNAIFIIIDKYTKKRYYVLYFNKNKKTLFKNIINILIKEIFRIYNFLTLTISNREL